MSKFVKLTSAGDGEPAYINMDMVEQISPSNDGNGSVIFYGDGSPKTVTETPEQILALIEDQSGDYLPF